MTIYIVYYLLVLFLYAMSGMVIIVNRNRQTKMLDRHPSGRRRMSEKWFVGLSFGLLTLLLGLRNQEMGVDLAGYLPAFDKLAAMRFVDVVKLKKFLNYEKGFILYNNLLGMISKDRQIYLFVCATLSTIPVGIVVYKHSKNTLLSLLVYLGLPVFLMSFSGMRQAIAIGITFCAYPLIVKKKLIPFVLTILLAMTFHYSSFIVLIAYPLYHWRIKRDMAIVSIALLPVIWLLKVPLFTIASKLFKENAVADNNGAITLFMVFTLMYVFCVFFADRRNPAINGLTNLCWISCALQAMGGVYQTVMRVGYYFMIYYILLIPEVVTERGFRKNEQYRFIPHLIAICFLFYGLYAIKMSSWPEANPYVFFWEIYRR